MQTKNVVFLIIDDDADDREFFKIALESLNAPTIYTSAADCCEAIKMLESRVLRPDFIFLDLNMPNMNGKECLTELRKNVHLLNIPITIFTTSSAYADRLETLNSGANDFITKPSKISDLTKIFSQYISTLSNKHTKNHETRID